jgi:sterol 3beta-glucosyltransferase
MRAVLTSFGSTGDAQPFLALAKELKQNGHHPVLALSPNFQARAEEHDIEFAPIGPMLKPSDIRGVITAQLTMTDPIEQARHFLDTVMPIMPRIYRELSDICRDADVLISSPHQIAGRMVHESLDLPFATVHLSQFGGLGSSALRVASADLINRFRAEEHLPPLYDPLTADAVSPQLALYAVSRCIVRQGTRRPSHHQVTGFFFLDDEKWRPDPQLVEFIEAGERPVAFTFGSVVHEDPEALTDLVLTAIEKAGCRAVIQHGWSGLAQRRLPDNVYATGFTPHSWLFPYAACVVHHGGAGTTAAALRAGVPAIIVPHTLDQPIWAEFVRALGCAKSVIPFARLDSEKLAKAILETLSAAGQRVTASKLGERIRAEEGVKTARELIEQLVSNRLSLSINN